MLYLEVIPLYNTHNLHTLIYKTDYENINVGDLIEIPISLQREKAIVYNISKKESENNYDTKSAGKVIAKKIFSKTELNSFLKISKFFMSHPFNYITKIIPEKIIQSNFTIPKDIFYKINNTKFGKLGKKQTKCIKLLNKFELTKKVLLKNDISTTTINSLLKKNYLIEYEKDIFKEKPKFLRKDVYKEICYVGSIFSAKIIKEKEWIEKILDKQKQVIILFPDKLTLDFYSEKYKIIFPQLSIYKNDNTKKNKEIFWEIKTGNTKLILTTKLGIFLPFHYLGGIIIFENNHINHYSHFKPYFNSIDMAKIYAKENSIPLLFTSNTYNSSIIYNNNEIHKFDDLFRVQKTIIDLSLNQKQKNEILISKYVLNEIQNTFNNNKKSILFLNRKGLYTSFVCKECGDFAISPISGLKMSVIKNKNKIFLQCKESGHSEDLYKHCKKCNGEMRFIGDGIQNLERILKNIFPNFKIITIDSDSFTKHNNEQIIKGIKNADIIIGTQILMSMGIIKNSELIIDILFDNHYINSSYITEEKIWQQTKNLENLLDKGNNKIIFQTFKPQKSLLKYIINDNFLGFYKNEIKERKVFNYPPFSVQIKIYLTGKKKELLEKKINKFIESHKNIYFYPIKFERMPYKQMINCSVIGLFPKGFIFKEHENSKFQIIRNPENI